MRQKIKSYLVFTSRGYRLVMFALVPLLLAALQAFFLKKMEGSAIPLIIMFLTAAEIMGDNWFLGGIQEKNAEKIDYLKTSGRGMKVMENALIMDFVRRFLTAAAIFGICDLLSRLLGGADEFRGLGIWLFSVLTSYSLSALGTLFARFGSYLWINILISYFAAAVGIVCCLLLMFDVSPWIFSGLLAVLGAGISVLAVKIAMRKVKGGYYDK